MKFESVQEVLASAFVSEVQPLLPDWFSRSSLFAQKGLKVLTAVLRHSGQKRFRPQHRRQVSNPEATTSYQDDYHWTKQASPLCELLKYRRLRELEYSEVMTGRCLECVQRWLDLKDEEYYVQVLMTLLREVYTCYKGAFKKKETTQKASFHVYSQADLLRASQDLRVSPQVRISRPSPMRSQPLSLPVSRGQSPVHFVSSGAPKPTQWLNSGVKGKFVSSYAENFKPHFIKFEQGKRPDMRTSMSITLIPRIEV